MSTCRTRTAVALVLALGLKPGQRRRASLTGAECTQNRRDKRCGAARRLGLADAKFPRYR
jgi:hypothetical protein